MRQRQITPENTECVILCFEGPDGYSSAGGLGVRVRHLSQTLAQMGFVTHLFFVGDPNLKGEEVRCAGRLTLHRWCQWISRHYPHGVYEGEDEKLYDFTDSVPSFVRDRIVKPAVERGKLVAILGEEWHTAEAMCHLSDILHNDGIRDNAVMFWNANNTYSFDRINWRRLDYATTLTTVSRYMKHVMWQIGLNPLVIPNGIPKSLLFRMHEWEGARIKQALDADIMLCKVARWDPAKGWNAAIEAVAGLKERGFRTVLLARGGSEPYGQELLQHACSLGLRVSEARLGSPSFNGYLSALVGAGRADVLDVKFPLPLDFLQVLYHSAHAVLANSSHEPFGIVGLEAMAAGGVAVTGCTGEDYAIPFVNCFVTETADPREIINYVAYLRDYPEENLRIRRAARETARYFTWAAAAGNLIRKLENQAWAQGAVTDKPTPPTEDSEIVGVTTNTQIESGQGAA